MNAMNKTMKPKRHLFRSKNRLYPFTIVDIIIGAVLLLMALIIIFPFYSGVMQSIVPQAVFRRSGFILIPQEITWENYQIVFQSESIWRSMAVSGIVTVVGTAYGMLLNTLGAYVWNFKYPGSGFIKFLMIFTMFFGGGLIPFYLLMVDLGLKNSIFAMILPAGVNLFYLIIIADGFKNLPSSLMEAARIDGANDITIFFKIMLPLSLPVLVTITLYTAVDRWNEWYNAMLFITDQSKFPLQLVLRNVINSASFIASSNNPGATAAQETIYADGLRMATIIVTMVPVLLIYPFLQRYFLKGITLGAVKE